MATVSAKTCINCGKPISARATRCRRCSLIDRNTVIYDQQFIRERITVNDAACWIWQECLDDQGYPSSKVGGEWGAHRLAYRLWHGPIPKGAEIDHACHDPKTCKVPPRACPHRACVNPDHLEAMTRRNNARKSGNPFGLNAQKTHCNSGHEFTPGNTLSPPSNKGRRRCRTCYNTKRRAKRATTRATPC